MPLFRPAVGSCFWSLSLELPECPSAGRGVCFQTSGHLHVHLCPGLGRPGPSSAQLVPSVLLHPLAQWCVHISLTALPTQHTSVFWKFPFLALSLICLEMGRWTCVLSDFCACCACTLEVAMLRSESERVEGLHRVSWPRCSPHCSSLCGRVKGGSGPGSGRRARRQNRLSPAGLSERAF